MIICNAISCPLCKLTTIKAIEMKLHTNVKHNKTMCHAQEPLLCFFLYFWSYFPLIICNAISCPLCKLTTIKAIEMKLHTVVKHNKTMCHAQEPQLCFGYFWSYSPLIICNAISCPLCKLTTIKAIEMKLHTIVKHNKTMCHAQEPLPCFFYIFGVISL